MAGRLVSGLSLAGWGGHTGGERRGGEKKNKRKIKMKIGKTRGSGPGTVQLGATGFAAYMLFHQLTYQVRIPFG